MKDTFPKITADFRTFSNFMAEISKVRKPFFAPSRSFYSKVTMDCTSFSPFRQADGRGRNGWHHCERRHPVSCRWQSGGH